MEHAISLDDFDRIVRGYEGLVAALMAEIGPLQDVPLCRKCEKRPRIGSKWCAECAAASRTEYNRRYYQRHKGAKPIAGAL